MFLLDTNSISELRKPRPHGAVLAWFQEQPLDTLALPSIVLYELQRGANRTRSMDPVKAKEIDQWIEAVAGRIEVLPFDVAEARLAAEFMGKREADLLPDAMIAATAAARNLIVVTRNTKDFIDFPVRLLNPFL